MTFYDRQRINSGVNFFFPLRRAKKYAQFQGVCDKTSSFHDYTIRINK